MKRRHAIILFIAVAAAANVVVVYALPWLINRVVLHKIVERALETANNDVHAADPAVHARARRVLERGGRNIALRAPPVTAASRTVVRPSPDLLYTACVFDLSKGPLLVQAAAPAAGLRAGYVSVSGFGPDTSNFFTREVGSQAATAPGTATPRAALKLLLVYGDASGLPAGVEVIHAPSARGLILFRSLITDPQALPAQQQSVQALQTCTPLQR